MEGITNTVLLQTFCCNITIITLKLFLATASITENCLNLLFLGYSCLETGCLQNSSSRCHD